MHDLACEKIATFMKGKSPEDVNKEFIIEFQLTQKEAKQWDLMLVKLLTFFVLIFKWITMILNYQNSFINSYK